MKIIISVFVLFLSISFGDRAFADQNSNKIYLDFGGEEYTLHNFNTIDFFHNFFGVYRKPIDLTQGIDLYLFPDFKFIYTEWGDIWEEKMIAQGTYTFKNGKISLNYTYKHKSFEQELMNDSFHVLWGQIDKKDYVTGFISVLANDEVLNKLRKRDKCFDYMERITELYDWQGMYKHFSNNKK